MASSSSDKCVHSWDLPPEGATTIVCRKCAGRLSRSSMVYCTSARGTGYCATDTRPHDVRSAQARVRGSVQVNRHYHRWYAMRDGCLLRLGKPYQSRIGARLAVVPKHLRARAVRGFIRTCDDACGQLLTTEQ